MTLFLLGERGAAQSSAFWSSSETRAAQCLPLPPRERVAQEAVEAPRC